MSMIYPLALAAVVLANVILIGRRWARPWWQRQRTVVEMCEVCGRKLTARQVRELRSDADDDAELDIGIGGTATIATYCRRHFPK